MNKLTLIALFGLLCIASAAVANCAVYETPGDDTTDCATCTDGYALGGTAGATTCTACTAASNCATCQDGVADCDTCKAGYGLIGSTCTKCKIENCAVCDGNVDECDLCSTGYANTRTDDAETDGSCVACENGCSECLTIDAGCAKCPTGQERNATIKDEPAFCCAVNCSTCSSTTACLTCKDGSTLSDSNACVFGYKTGASLTLGAVVSVAILSLLF